MSTGNLFYLYFKVTAYNLKEQLYVIFKFYRNLRFLFLDLFLSIFYMVINPYKVARHFYQKKFRRNVHIYGETPLRTIEKLAKESNLCPQDRLYEIGAGRGRVGLWLASFVKCEVVACEIVPLFVRIAKLIKKVFRLKNIVFEEADFFEQDYSNATAVYIYGTSLEDFEIELLLQKLKQLPSGAKVISVSYPLTHYDPISYALKKIVEVSFPWGKSYAYIQVKN